MFARETYDTGFARGLTGRSLKSEVLHHQEAPYFMAGYVDGRLENLKKTFQSIERQLSSPTVLEKRDGYYCVLHRIPQEEMIRIKHDALMAALTDTEAVAINRTTVGPILCPRSGCEELVQDTGPTPWGECLTCGKWYVEKKGTP